MTLKDELGTSCEGVGGCSVESVPSATGMLGLGTAFDVSLVDIAVSVGCSRAYEAEPGTGLGRRVRGVSLGIVVSRGVVFGNVVFFTELSNIQDLILLPRKDFLHARLHTAHAR